MSLTSLNSHMRTMNFSGDLMGDIQELTLIADDFGEAADSEFASELLDVDRRVLFQEDCVVRIGGVDKQAFAARMYILSDIILVGRYRVSKKRKTMKKKTMDKIVFGKNNFKTRDEYDDNQSQADLMSQVQTQRTLRGMDDKVLKVKLWVDLEGNNVKVKDIRQGESHGFRIIYTTKEHVDNNGEVEIITSVDQTEIFFESEKQMKQFSAPVHDAINDLLEKQLKDLDGLSQNGSFTLRNSSTIGRTSMQVEAMDDTTIGDTQTLASRSGSMKTGKMRSYAKSKATMKKKQIDKNRGGKSNVFSLKDIENKYKTQMTPKAQEDLTTFAVSFKQGAMGFGVLASAGLGVFVGKLGEGGMADLGGVTLGDRVVNVGGTEITVDTSREQFVSMVKAKKAEVGSDGKPKPLKIVFSRLKEVDVGIVKNKQDEDEAELRRKVRERREKRKKTGGKRDWQTRRTQGKAYGTRVNSLSALEDKYKEGGSEAKKQEKVSEFFKFIIENTEEKSKERQCAFILREIHDTEKSFVGDLYMLKEKYLDRLVRKQIKVPCNENSELKTKFCEHGIAVKKCKQLSTKLVHLITVDDKKVVFMNIEIITKLNEELIASLQHGILKLEAKKEKVGVTDLMAVYAPAFTRHMPYYALYSQYASRYAKALDRLNTLEETNANFKEELMAIESRKGVKRLKQLMMTPVQRLTKYPLLFKTLAANMRPYLATLTQQIIASKGEGDIEKLITLVNDMERTNEVVEKVAATVDCKVDEHSKNESLNEIYNELGGVQYIKEFFKPSRKFIQRFENVTVVEKKPKKQKVMLVFNDLIIIGSYRKGALKTLTPGNKSKTGGLNKSQKASMVSKSSDSRTLRKNKEKGRSGMFGLFGKKQQPDIKIDYMGEMTKLNVALAPKKNAEGWTGVQCYLASIPSVEEEKKRTRRSVSRNESPAVMKLEVFFEKEVDRQSLVSAVQEEKQNFKKKEQSKRDAKESMGNARRQLRAKKKLQDKAASFGNSNATLSANRQQNIRQKMLEQREKRRNKAINNT